MLDKVLNSCNYVANNSKYVKINYDKINLFLEELNNFDNQHYFTKIPYPIIEMNIKNIVDFLLVYDSINYSFWGEPKWSIEAINGTLDGGMALFNCIYNLFNGKDSEDIFKFLEKMSKDEFRQILKGNVEIPLFEERYQTVIDISRIVNKRMSGSFYKYIRSVYNDQELFDIIISNFPTFKDERIYKGKTIYFYKLAQLLTSDILHMIQLKDNISVDYSHLAGCADYKIPQIMRSLGILKYNDELEFLIANKQEIEEGSEYEVEIRASMLIVINYIYEQLNAQILRIDINDFIWSKGQEKTIPIKPYHLTRTTNY